MCINKPDRYDYYRHITHIGGVNPDGSKWHLSEEEAIAGIRRGEWTFYVEGGGRTVWVTIEKGPSGREYLKTEPDGYREDNLLSLPECT
jgi:hypothetical protein